MTKLPTLSNKGAPNTGRISKGTMAYVMSRNQHTAHDTLLRAIRKSGKTQRELAQLTGMDEATISRVLGRPSNFQINTYGKLLFAACGSFAALVPESLQSTRSNPTFSQAISPPVDRQVRPLRRQLKNPEPLIAA